MRRTIFIFTITFMLIGAMLGSCGNNDDIQDNERNLSQSETPSQGMSPPEESDNSGTPGKAPSTAGSNNDTMVEDENNEHKQSSESQQQEKINPSGQLSEDRDPAGLQESGDQSKQQPGDLSSSKGQGGPSQPERQPGDPNSSERAGGNTNPSTKNESENWMLLLVNAENPMPDGYAPALKALENGLKFDERAIDQLNAMLSEAKNQGLSPVVCSAYRTVEYQRTLFNNNVSKLVASGYSQAQAEKETARGIAYPGTSEHGIGLAADIVSNDYQQLTEKQADTPEVKWLHKHCSDYGFILRYPKDKEDITGIKYEPWHFRYVGVKAAVEIMENGLCLEEYPAP